MIASLLFLASLRTPATVQDAKLDLEEPDMSQNTRWTICPLDYGSSFLPT